MAVKGDVGKLMFENAGGTEANIGELRSWSLSVSKDTQENNRNGGNFKDFYRWFNQWRRFSRTFI